LLIANRGEIALRIARTARRMGLEIVAVYSDADADAPHVRAADVAVRLGPSAPSESYLNIDAVLAAARASTADAVHPGYGFLAESAEFAERCAAAGLTFVGPPAAAMLALGDKASAKRLLEGSGVPFVPGYHGTDQRDDVLLDEARRIGFPVMIKASAGGGGRGMRLALEGANVLGLLQSARSEAQAAFGNGELLLERALVAPRHVEVQIFADTFGNVIHLGERDCSVQRRHQKLIEESPSPAVDAGLRERLGAAAIAVARKAAYAGAGTVEFLLDAGGDFYFIEMNARLQVEHPVTEAITGLDLVEWQLRIARGEPLPLPQDAIVLRGHAIEARLCAEDPARDFLPQAGTLVAWQRPGDVRVEDALEAGIAISPYYDSMIAKFIAFGETREDARLKLVRGLEACVALGLPTNKAALLACLRDETFAAGNATTRFIEERISPLEFGGEPPFAAVALAGALLFTLAAERGAFGPWTSWSTSHLPASSVALSLDGRPTQTLGIEVRKTRELYVSAGSQTALVEFASLDANGGAARYRLDGGPWLAAAFSQTGDRAFLECDGRAYAIADRNRELAAAAASSAGDGFLRAPMSGRVVSLIGVSGDVAKAGTSLAVLEAMKMEHALSLPVDVVLREVTASAGLQVNANDILLSYDPVTAATSG
jgi:geranyl-CoA carboxylase alpha subunit